MKLSWPWRAGFAAAGGAAGYAYYHFVGCLSGTCPITGNPWISTLYGGVMALLLLSIIKPAQPR